MNCGRCGGVVIGGMCQYCGTGTNPNRLVVDEFMVVAIITGIVSSIAANYIYDKWRK
jgi:hypothetical protein